MPSRLLPFPFSFDPSLSLTPAGWSLVASGAAAATIETGAISANYGTSAPHAVLSTRRTFLETSSVSHLEVISVPVGHLVCLSPSFLLCYFTDINSFLAFSFIPVFFCYIFCHLIYVSSYFLVFAIFFASFISSFLTFLSFWLQWYRQWHVTKIVYGFFLSLSSHLLLHSSSLLFFFSIVSSFFLVFLIVFCSSDSFSSSLFASSLSL